MPSRFIGTTLLSVRHSGRVAMAGDGQVSLDRAQVESALAERVINRDLSRYLL